MNLPCSSLYFHNRSYVEISYNLSIRMISNQKMSLTRVSTEHISLNPEIRFGKPCIKGTRIAVIDIVNRYLEMEESLEDIAQDYNLSLASVYSAMAYYYDHREEIEIRRAEGEAFAQEFTQNHPSLLQEKLKKLKGE